MLPKRSSSPDHLPRCFSNFSSASCTAFTKWDIRYFNFVFSTSKSCWAFTACKRTPSPSVPKKKKKKKYSFVPRVNPTHDHVLRFRSVGVMVTFGTESMTLYASFIRWQSLSTWGWQRWLKKKGKARDKAEISYIFSCLHASFQTSYKQMRVHIKIYMDS